MSGRRPHPKFATDRRHIHRPSLRPAGAGAEADAAAGPECGVAQLHTRAPHPAAAAAATTSPFPTRAPQPHVAVNNPYRPRAPSAQNYGEPWSGLAARV